MRAAEATAARPAYSPSSGFNGSLGLYATYELTQHSRLLGGLTLTRWSNELRRSPIVEDRLQVSGVLGVMYDFSGERKPWSEHKPLIVRALHGASTDCSFIHIVTARCASVHTRDDTNIQAIEIGRTLVDKLNGWPVSFAGFVGLLRHRERGFQPDFWQVNAYLKAYYYYGFPWSERVKTRIGFGSGLAYARRIPMPEAIDQARRGRTTSKLLNYLDPSIDFSVGDLMGVRSLKGTYVGVASSHRSGIFGSSQLLGNVNGGSNYLYGYVEWTM